jgi:hypothetical protein
MARITNLRKHFQELGINYTWFVRIAEANWNQDKLQYEGIRAMSRILGISDTSMIKYLKIYDKQIGRQRNGTESET